MPQPDTSDAASGMGRASDRFVGSVASSGRTTTVAALLRARIQSGELSHGDRLPSERELARQMGVSRLTLRAALEELRREGYLTARRGQGGGNFVTELTKPVNRWLGNLADDLDEIEDILEHRIALECRCAALAAVRADDGARAALKDAMLRFERSSNRTEFRRADADFHSLLAVASGSRRLAELVPKVRGELFYPVDHLAFDPPKSEAVLEHRAVYDALMARDADRASAAMLTHLEHTRRELRLLANGPSPS
jgi:DNA-binding FadR family transcriptional regulator